VIHWLQIFVMPISEHLRRHYVADNKRLDKWLEAAYTGQWLGEQTYQRMRQFDKEQVQLIAGYSGVRPLIVALFGGTGVGKSSLINALAGVEVAKTGVVRPTSTDICIYHHQSVTLAELPPDMPKAMVKTHEDASLAKVVLVDMPDIDSRITEHHAKALAWLEVIDVALYVVSPERYRDRKGFTELVNHGGKHAWIFVFNQWDMAHDSQLVNFSETLQDCGFNKPNVFRTALEGGETFDLYKLREHLLNLAAQNLDLSIIPLYDRCHERVQDLQLLQQRLGEEAHWRDIIKHFQKWQADNVATTLKSVTQAGATHAAVIGEQYQPSWRWWLFKRKPTIPEEATRDLSHVLTQTLENLDLKTQARERLTWQAQDYPIAPLWARMLPEYQDMHTRLVSTIPVKLDQALRKPGGGGWRFIHRTAGIGRFMLPLLSATTIIGISYYRLLHGMADTGMLSSLGFIVNAGLILLLSWFVPAVLYRLTSPSVRESLTTAIRRLWKAEHQRLQGRLARQQDQFLKERSGLAEGLNQLRCAIERDISAIGKRLEEDHLHRYTNTAAKKHKTDSY
jgi:GTPase SAR1 family protein